MIKKVLIVPANTDLNRGDQSLTWESIAIAKDLFKDVEVCLYKSGNKSASSNDINSQTEKLGHRILTRILAHPRRNEADNKVNHSKLRYVRWGIVAIYDVITTLLLLSKIRLFNSLGYQLLSRDRQETYRYFKQIDVVFVKGGGFLHSYGSITDPYVMYFQLFDVLLANRMKKKVVLLPNSVGPLKNSLAKYIVKKALSKCCYVAAREGVSQDFLRDLGVSSKLSPDLGFYLKPSDKDFAAYLTERGVNLEAPKKIAITLRPYRFDGGENANQLYQQYVNQFKNVIEGLIKNDYHVSLVAHTIGPSAHEDDCIPLLELYKFFETDPRVTYLFDRSLDCRDIEKIYQYYDLVIGTRFHSVIFSMNVGTPAIAIAYGGNKAVGIMNDMNLGQYVVPIENPDGQTILASAEEIFKTTEAYIEKINDYKAILIKKRLDILSDIEAGVYKK